MRRISVLEILAVGWFAYLSYVQFKPDHSLDGYLITDKITHFEDSKIKQEGETYAWARFRMKGGEIKDYFMPVKDENLTDRTLMLEAACNGHLSQEHDFKLKVKSGNILASAAPTYRDTFGRFLVNVWGWSSWYWALGFFLAVRTRRHERVIAVSDLPGLCGQAILFPFIVVPKWNVGSIVIADKIQPKEEQKPALAPGQQLDKQLTRHGY